MLRKIRIVAALLFFAGVTLLFLDFTGALHAWLGWMAKVQLLPALLALNVGVVAALVALTLLFGRVYCSVVCPLGVMQDLFAWAGRRRKRNRYAYSPARKWLRCGLLALFIAAMAANAAGLAALIAPYSAYGRIVQNLFAPLWGWANNALAYLAERADSYAFYTTEVWVRSWSVFAVAAATLAVVGVLAWRNGRTWCNTVCPVGTFLGFLSKYSLFRPVIDTSKCNGCTLCARNCKAACIDAKNHRIDYSRCVVCMDCIDNCRQGAISYAPRRRSAVGAAGAVETVGPVGTGPAEAAGAKRSAGASGASRRSFLGIVGILAWTGLRAQEKKVDGGLAAVSRKRIPGRATRLTPPGSFGLRHLATHCTGCQLCVAACPNQVLRPSGGAVTLLQPEMSYERGYCRPECTKCSEVCPTGAIRPLTRADKSSVQIGHAVWIRENCVPLTRGVECGNCARHCPSGAIAMVSSDPSQSDAPKIPVVNTERCIGCGACENLCPARPFSAIYVEGHEVHRTI